MYRATLRFLKCCLKEWKNYSKAQNLLPLAVQCWQLWLLVSTFITFSCRGLQCACVHKMSVKCCTQTTELKYANSWHSGLEVHKPFSNFHWCIYEAADRLTWWFCPVGQGRSDLILLWDDFRLWLVTMKNVEGRSTDAFFVTQQRHGIELVAPGQL